MNKPAFITIFLMLLQQIAFAQTEEVYTFKIKARATGIVTSPGASYSYRSRRDPTRVIGSVIPPIKSSDDTLALEYPPVALDSAITGLVEVSYQLDASGKPTKVKVTKKADPVLNAAALNYVRNLPAVSPVTNARKKLLKTKSWPPPAIPRLYVSMKKPKKGQIIVYTMPIRFSLEQ